MVNLACQFTQSQNPKNYSDALYAVSGAKDIKYSKLFGEQLYYNVKDKFPGEQTISNISEYLRSKGWVPLAYDYGLTELKNSHVRGWTHHFDGTTNPEREVYLWMAQWENATHDVVWYGLKYSWVAKAKPDLDNMELVCGFIPSVDVVKMRENAKQMLNQNNKKPDSTP